MNRYEIIVGRHVGEDGKRYGKGEPNGMIVETTIDMVKMFPNKFTKLMPKGSDTEKVIDDDNEKTESEDVTAKFDDAVKAGLEVRKVGKLYVVTDPKDEEAGNLDEGALTSQAKVKTFLADYIAERKQHKGERIGTI